MRKNWAVFISGRGSNMAALFELGSALSISLVVSSKRDCPGVRRARRFGVPVKFFSKDDDWTELTAELQGMGVNHLFLAGFMRILPKGFVEQWQGRIWNVHPSLLPKYPGLNSMERAFSDKSDMGISLHQVDSGVDTGLLVKQKIVFSSEDMKRRGEGEFSETEFLMHRMEHRLVQEVLPCL